VCAPLPRASGGGVRGFGVCDAELVVLSFPPRPSSNRIVATPVHQKQEQGPSGPNPNHTRVVLSVFARVGTGVTRLVPRKLRARNPFMKRCRLDEPRHQLRPRPPARAAAPRDSTHRLIGPEAEADIDQHQQQRQATSNCPQGRKPFQRPFVSDHRARGGRPLISITLPSANEPEGHQWKGAAGIETQPSEFGDRPLCR